MFGLTPAHLVLILIIALIVVGPGKLPEVGAAMGKSIREFQKASSGAQETVVSALTAPAVPQPPAVPYQAQPSPYQAQPAQPNPVEPVAVQMAVPTATPATPTVRPPVQPTVADAVSAQPAARADS